MNFRQQNQTGISFHCRDRDTYAGQVRGGRLSTKSFVKRFDRLEHFLFFAEIEKQDLGLFLCGKRNRALCRDGRAIGSR